MFGIARERDARPRIVAHVSEDHRDDADGRPPVVGDAHVAPVIDGALGVPRIEDGLHGEVQLLGDVLRKVAPRRFAHDRLEAFDDPLPRSEVEFGIRL